MNATNKTLYIPLYGKSLVSKKGILLHDPKAEEIWQKEGFPLRGKPKSKWLAYYMGMRAWVMDQWLTEKLNTDPAALVLHLGCGLDARVHRVKAPSSLWFDVDMPDVIRIRQQYYKETPTYRMIGADVTDPDWLDMLPHGEKAVVVMEGLSMYLPMEKLQALMDALSRKYPQLSCLMDVYTCFAVKASAYKNPIQAVGASVCTGVDDPKLLEQGNLRFDGCLTMTPEEKIQELSPLERCFFRLMFAGKSTEKIYRMYRYESKEKIQKII